MKDRRRRYAPPGDPIKSRARVPGEGRLTGPPDAVPAPPMLRLVRPDEPAPGPPSPRRRPRFERGRRASLVAAGLAVLVALAWWSATSDERAIRELPQARRVPLLRSTLENLRDVCDPAPPLSLREFCRQQAELAIKFDECIGDPACRRLARRHLYQPHR